jgi:hypothetical protein
MYRVESPRAARRYLRVLQDESSHFYARDGSVLKSVFDLYSFLKNCDKETFQYHVNGSKNDLADWVADVILDEELARHMDNCLLRYPMQYRLLLRINFLIPQSHKKSYGAEKANLILEDMVVPEEFFLTADGQSIRSIWELQDFLGRTDDETFSAHVNEERNDIATWVDDILYDTELAKTLERVMEKREMAKHVKKRIRSLEKRAKNKKKSKPGYPDRVKRSVKKPSQ